MRVKSFAIFCNLRLPKQLSNRAAVSPFSVDYQYYWPQQYRYLPNLAEFRVEKRRKGLDQYAAILTSRSINNWYVSIALISINTPQVISSFHARWLARSEAISQAYHSPPNRRRETTKSFLIFKRLEMHVFVDYRVWFVNFWLLIPPDHYINSRFYLIKQIPHQSQFPPEIPAQIHTLVWRDLPLFVIVSQRHSFR